MPPTKVALPIDDFLPEVCAKFSSCSNLIITAEPGAGKTTRVPPALLKLCPGKILVLEPRRVATVSAAVRIADENAWDLGGNEVGYQVRFDSKSSANTRIVFLTEALLAKRMVADSELRNVDVVILDEFHERSLHADLALGLLKELQELARPDLKIIVMSATLDTAELESFLPDSFVFKIPGKTFPLHIEYSLSGQSLNTDFQFIAKMTQALKQAWNSGGSGAGHILMFLPGLSEIERIAREIESIFPAGSIHKLYGLMSLEEQRAVLRPSSLRKIVLATNVAESSVTIDGVDTVIDSGLARSSRIDSRTGLSRLETVRISRASATQRAGRAARQMPGTAIRMWTQMDERSMPEFETPEVLQSPLDEVVLLLAGMGIAQPQNFSWLTVPSSAPFSKAIEELRLIGAVDSSGAITDLGQKILGLPTSPRLGKLLLTARANGLPDFGARACAVLSERDFLKNPPNSSSESDLLDRTEVIERSGAGKRVYQQLLVRNGAKDRSTDLNETLFEVFSDRLARRRSKGQKNAVLISGRGVTLHDHSQVKQSEFFLCLQLQTTAQSDDPVVFWAHGLPTDFVIKKLKTKASLKKSLRFDKENLQFWTDEALAVGHFVIEEARQRKATSEEIGSALSERLFENWDWFLSKNIALSRWWSRYRFFCTQENLPTLTEAELRSVLELACYGENALAPLFEKDVVYFLEQALESDLILRLNSAFYPAYLQVPSGRSHWIDYSAGVPKLEVKLQELFGLTETPRLGAKNLPLTLVMLSPNGSPMQTTQDLESFWSKGYFEVRADLRSRYPKHPWPDDPLTAQATHKTKKQR